MSHFFIGVCVKIDEQARDISALIEENEEFIRNKVDELLAPYDENFDVEEYERECWCIGQVAHVEAVEFAEKETGRTLGNLRTEFSIMPVGSVTWKQYAAEYEEARSKCLNSHPMKELPDPNCDECKGTGKITTTSNPDGKWDWWVIGGRWDGEILKLEAIPDGQGGFNFGDVFHTVKRNTSSLKAYLDHLKDETLEEVDSPPFAIVTSDGKWVEKGNMGWFGMATGELQPENWRRHVIRHLEKEGNDVVIVGVDCHV